MKRKRIDLRFRPYWKYLDQISRLAGDILFKEVKEARFRRAKVFGFDQSGTIDNYFTPHTINKISGEKIKKEYQALDLEFYYKFRDQVKSVLSQLDNRTQEQYKKLKLHIEARIASGDLIAKQWRKIRKQKNSIRSNSYLKNENSEGVWQLLEYTEWRCLDFSSSHKLHFLKCKRPGICDVKLEFDNVYYRRNTKFTNLVGTATYHSGQDLLHCIFTKSVEDGDTNFILQFFIKIPSNQIFDFLLGYQVKSIGELSTDLIILERPDIESKFIDRSNESFTYSGFGSYFINFANKYFTIDSSVYDRETFFTFLETYLPQFGKKMTCFGEHSTWKLYYTSSEHIILGNVEFNRVFPDTIEATFFNTELERSYGLGLLNPQYSTVTFEFNALTLFIHDAPINLTLKFGSEKLKYSALAGYFSFRKVDGSYETSLAILVKDSYNLKESEMEMLEKLLIEASDVEFTNWNGLTICEPSDFEDLLRWVSEYHEEMKYRVP